MTGISARRMYLYLFYVIVALYVIVAPALSTVFPAQINDFFAASKLGFNVIPSDMWFTLFGGHAIYAAGKSYEKSKGVNDAGSR